MPTKSETVAFLGASAVGLSSLAVLTASLCEVSAAAVSVTVGCGSPFLLTLVALLFGVASGPDTDPDLEDEKRGRNRDADIERKGSAWCAWCLGDFSVSGVDVDHVRRPLAMGGTGHGRQRARAVPRLTPAGDSNGVQLCGLAVLWLLPLVDLSSAAGTLPLTTKPQLLSVCGFLRPDGPDEHEEYEQHDDNQPSPPGGRVRQSEHDDKPSDLAGAGGSELPLRPEAPFPSSVPACPEGHHRDVSQMARPLPVTVARAATAKPLTGCPCNRHRRGVRATTNALMASVPRTATRSVVASNSWTRSVTLPIRK